MVFHELSCCGIKEISGCSSWSPQKFFHLVNRYDAALPCAYVIFNGVKGSHYVENFANWLAQQQVGDIDVIPSMRNPNSGNELDVRIWRVNRDALVAWWLRTIPEMDKVKFSSPGCNCNLCCRSNRATLTNPYAAPPAQAHTAPQAGGR